MAKSKKAKKSEENGNVFSGTVETCAHRVSFEYWGFRVELTDELESGLTDEAERRAHDMIAESGCIAGELNYLHDGETEIRGWWEIKD